MDYEHEASSSQQGEVPITITVSGARSTSKAMASGSSETLLIVKEYCNEQVPLTLHTEKLMVQITGSHMCFTPSLDLVVVLDTSGSMAAGEKLKEMKQAAKDIFLNMDQSSDTLTFISFSGKVEDKNVLEVDWNKDGKDVENYLNGINARGPTNTQAGLAKAIETLSKHKEKKPGSVAGIFLMSDGEQERNDVARDVDVHEFAVYTFSFGEGDKSRHDFLSDVATRSHRGKYYSQSTEKNLKGIIISVLKENLRNVSALDLNVTLTQKENKSTIVLVDPGMFVVTSGKGWFKIRFGDLARKEELKIIVGIQLPAVLEDQEKKTEVMDIKCEYRVPTTEASERTVPYTINMARHREAPLRCLVDDSLVSEIARREHVNCLAKIIYLIDVKDFGKAKIQLDKAMEAIEDNGKWYELPHKMKMKKLKEKFDSKDWDYCNKRGRADLLSAKLTLSRHCFSHKGDDNNKEES